MDLSASGHSVSLDGVYCGALMYVDDLVLIADSPAELQELLDISAAYASKWRYLHNASKSFVLVFGESPRSHSRLWAQHSWHIDTQLIEKCDEIKHLGVLHSVDHSILSLILDRCKAGRSAFYSLLPMLVRFTLLLLSACILLFACLLYYMGVNLSVFPRATYCFLNVSTVKYCAPFRTCLFDALLLRFWVC